MSFAALQMAQYDNVHFLDNGTLNASHPLAFSATLADNETFYYGQAMAQPDKHLFIKAMVKEIDDLTSEDIWAL
jgi:hypothetical protein